LKKVAHQSTLVDMEHLLGNDIVIKRAFQKIDQANWAEEELNTYDKIVKIRLDNLAVEQQEIEDAETCGKTKALKRLTQKITEKGMASYEIVELIDPNETEIA
jgi:hypothetical protein